MNQILQQPLSYWLTNQNKMKKSQTILKLPAIDLTISKLFQTDSSLKQAKTAFLDLIKNQQQQNKPKSQNDQSGSKSARCLIQLPRNNKNSGFVSFNSINKNETNQIINSLSRLRSKSTLIKSSIKAEIVSNNNQMQKILRQNQQFKRIEKQFITKKLKEMAPIKMKKEIKIKEKFKAKVPTVKKIILTMDFSIYQNNLSVWKPYIDYQSNIIMDKNLAYFIGGRQKFPIVSYDAYEDKWKQNQLINTLRPFGNTSGSIMQSSDQATRILFFGGYNFYQPAYSQICNTLKIVNVSANTIQIQEFPQNKAPHRAFHSQCIYGKYLIVSGGLNKKNRHFNNFMNYNYEKKFWSELTVFAKPNQLQKGFAKHCSLPIFHKRKAYSIYDEEPIFQFDPSIQTQGIYLYGGENGNNDIMSKVYIVKLGSPSINIIEPKIDGTPPFPRKNTTMIRSNSFIIIHGGRNEQMNPFVLNSMHFLNLLTMNWIEIQGQKPPFRYSHGLGVFDKNIVILGGKNIEGLSKEVFIMNYRQKIQYA